MTSRNHRGFQEEQGQGRNLTLGFLSGLDKQNQEENGGDQDEQDTSDKAEIIYLHELTPSVTTDLLDTPGRKTDGDSWFNDRA